MAKLVVGLFENMNEAQQAVRDLTSAGYDDHLTFVQAAEPGLRAQLVSAGIPEQDAEIYVAGVQQGGGLVLLQALDDQQAGSAADILDQYHVVDISRGTANYDSGQTTRDTSRAGMTNLYQGGEVKLPIIQEELRIGKRAVERGGVRVNVDVKEVPVNEQVTLRDETIDVHRRKQDRPVTNEDLAILQQGAFEVRERDEEALVDKQARIVEEVHVKKEVQERTENVQDTVRRTDVDVEEIQGHTRAVGSRGTTDEGMLERGASRTGNAVERATNTDLDQDGDVGQRDRRNNY